jgi:hypothetical protein
VARLVRALGLDPSLSHGVLLAAAWNFSPAGVPQLDSYESLYTWGKTKASIPGLNKSSTPEEMFAWGHRMVLAVSEAGLDPAVPLFIDWDERSVLWKGQGIYANKTSLLIGYISRGFQQRGTPVIVLSPAEVRSHFGLKNNAKKDEVWEESGLTLDERTNSDLRDTLLLSYVGAASINRSLVSADRGG